MNFTDSMCSMDESALEYIINEESGDYGRASSTRSYTVRTYTSSVGASLSGTTPGGNGTYKSYFYP